MPIDWEKLYGKGENPNGMISHTPNGVERNGMGSEGMGERWGGAPNGRRWQGDPMPPIPDLESAYEPMSVSGGMGTPIVPRNKVMVASHTRRKPR